MKIHNSFLFSLQLFHLHNLSCKTKLNWCVRDTSKIWIKRRANRSLLPELAHTHLITIMKWISYTESCRLEGKIADYLLQSLLSVGPIRSGCWQLSPLELWISPGMQIPQPPWVSCSIILPLSWKKSIFPVLGWSFHAPASGHSLLSFHCIPPRRAWLWLLYILPSDSHRQQ